MTRVDFYVVPQDAGGGQDIVACRLAEKAYRVGHHVHIHVDSHADAVRIDELLWTFRAGSFVPHCLAEDTGAGSTPVVIGYQEQPQHGHDVLINLSSDVPLFFSRFERVAEVVDHHHEHRAAARERYRFYRDRGYPLQSHEL